MLATFVHILKADSIRGLYRGVCAPKHPSPAFAAPSTSKLSNLAKSAPALRLPPPPNNLLHHALRHLLRAQRDLHDRSLLPLSPLFNRHGQHLRLPRRHSRQPSRRTKRPHAARRRSTRRQEAELQERPRRADKDDAGRRLAEPVEGRVAEQSESHADDGEPARQLRQLQADSASQHVVAG